MAASTAARTSATGRLTDTAQHLRDAGMRFEIGPTLLRRGPVGAAAQHFHAQVVRECQYLGRGHLLLPFRPEALLVPRDAAPVAVDVGQDVFATHAIRG